MYVEKFAIFIRLLLLLAELWTEMTASVVQPNKELKKLGYLKSSAQAAKCITSRYVNFLFGYTNTHCAHTVHQRFPPLTVRRAPTALSD